MKKISLFFALALSMIFSGDALAQGTSFEEFRRGILDDFNSFRNRILDQYADFLEGEWHEYEPLMQEKRYKTPKPSQAPDALTMPPDGEATTGMPLSAISFTKATHAAAEKGDSVGSVDYIPVSGKPDTQFELPPRFEIQRSEDSREGMESLVYHGMEFLIPAFDYELWKTYEQPADVSKQWYKLNRARVGKTLVPVFESLCKKLGLNGYLTYDLLCHYVDGKFPEDGIIGKVSLVHYLLANMGYDARLGFSAAGDPVILMRSDQKLYQVERVNLEDNLYYMFNPLGREIGNVRTCYIPASPDMGEKFDFRINGLNLPMREGNYDIALGKIHLKGSVNKNIYPVVYRYPQLECSDIAESNLLSDVRSDVVSQVREQLKEMDTLDAVNELLNFTQLGFDYATDPDFHGFEKPYFFEENLFYPYNDCEDRAIFYTYLLWNALGLENHLLEYPEHESAAVALPMGIKGTGYRLDGKKYYISDPTYLHSQTGACMPCFRKTIPVINFRYSREDDRHEDSQ